MYLLQGLNFVGQLFDLEGELKKWTAIANEYHLLESKSFQWMQLVDALETPWKRSIRKQNTNLNSLGLYDHHLINLLNHIFLVNLIPRNYIIFSF